MFALSKSLGAASVALVCVAALAPMPSGAQTFDKQASVKSSAPDDGLGKKPVAKKTVPKKSAKPTYDRGSAETTPERTARLKRECKGGVNAGACAGYTR